MRWDAAFLLVLSLAVADSSNGRSLQDNLPPQASITVVLPDGVADRTAGDASPLLDAPPVEGRWEEVTDAPPLIAPTTGAGSFDAMQPRIIYGQADTQAKFPYGAYILWDMGGEYGACSGSLVAPGYILTAAHCFEEKGRNATISEVKAWVYGTWHNVSAIMRHPGFRNLDNPVSEPSNDVAMLALTQDSDVAPARLPSWDQPTPGMKVWAAGFGLTETGQSSDRLRYTTLTVLEDGKCPNGYRGGATCPGGFADDFVAGGLAGYTCNGDSGGPIVRATATGDVQVGLTSFGDINCYVPFAYYVRIYDHRSTISQWLLSRNDTAQSGLNDGVRQWIQDVSATPSAR